MPVCQRRVRSQVLSVWCGRGKGGNMFDRAVTLEVHSYLTAPELLLSYWCIISYCNSTWSSSNIQRFLVDWSTLFLWQPSIDTHLESLCSKFPLAMILRWRDMRNNMNYTSPLNTVISMSGHRNSKNAQICLFCQNRSISEEVLIEVRLV